jgi:DnaJ homolog subfamily A member 2
VLAHPGVDLIPGVIEGMRGGPREKKEVDNKKYYDLIGVP